MKNLWIVGAGGFGRELFFWLKHSPENGVNWNIAGFVDDPLVEKGIKGNPIEKYLKTYNLKLKAFEDEKWTDKDIFVIGIGQPLLKEKVINKMIKQGVQFLTFMHPSAIIGEFVEIGYGSVICPNCIITCDVNIGKFVTINIGSTVGHDCKIGDFTVISGNCDITGNCKLGQKVFLGTHANLNPGTIIEDGATVGAGSFGIGKVKKEKVVLGVPARKWMI